MNYLRDALRPTPQSEPLDERQVPNSAGGYAFEASPEQRLRRFLILGTEGGSYYASERDLTKSAVATVRRLVKENGRGVVDVVREVSEGGLAPKNDPALLALAIATAEGDLETRRAAAEALPAVARTATHLFHWIAFRDALAGWGPVARRAVASWYEDKDPAQLAYQVVKYRQRDGVSHADALRLAHPRATTDAHGHIYDLACELALRQRGAEGRSERRPTEHDPDEAMLAPDGELAKVQGYLYARESESPARTARLVREYGLPREALKTEHLDSVEVWDALLEGMPITATIRNLGNMTRLGLLTPTSEATQRVLERLADEDRLRRGRVHPIQVLAAHTTYASGGGARGSGSWDPVVQVVDALDAAFYTSFGSVEPTGKRTMLAIDISGSMSYNNIAGVPGLLARTGAAAMALVTAAVEQRYEVTAFSSPTWSSAGLETVPLSPRQRLDDAIRAINSLRAGGTDCALPMLWAEEQGREVDTFVVYTDNETWAGSVHPAQALRDYRQRSGIHDAKLIVVGMVANDFTIADPADEGMLDVVGFDTSAPNLMSAFARGEL